MKLKELYENKAAFTDFDKWKAAVEKANPGKKLQFKGRVEGGKSTVSAEVKGEDRCYGVWDDDQNTGELLGEGWFVRSMFESEVIKPDEEGWYVCDYKERPIHGPMSESKAKALADQLSTESRPCSAEYYSDYQISRMNEGLFSRKKEEPKNEPITADDRKMIDNVLKGHHNGHLKQGGDYLFPDNVHAVTDKKHITFYKRGGVLKASVGHYPGGAGDPKKRPLVHSDHDIKSDEDMKKLVEGVADPFQKFKKGQIVTVKKTGAKVKVLAQNDIGLVQTVKVGGGVPGQFPKHKGSVVPGIDHQEYMPRELEA